MRTFIRRLASRGDRGAVNHVEAELREGEHNLQEERFGHGRSAHRQNSFSGKSSGSSLHRSTHVIVEVAQAIAGVAYSLRDASS